MYLGLTPGPAGTASALPALRGLGAEAAIPAQVNKSPSKWRKARAPQLRGSGRWDFCFRLSQDRVSEII